MALEDLKITENDLVGKGVSSLTENKYVGDADMLKARFDSKPDFIIERFNSLIDGLGGKTDGEGVTKIVITDTEPTAETQSANPTTLYLVVE